MRSVIFMVDHSEKGAMGLIVNKQAHDMTLTDVLEKLDTPLSEAADNMAVRIGGPVETERGFVLHSPEYRSAIQTIDISTGFALTATQDVLDDLARGKGPAQAMLILGYSGWGPGQLEAEISQNGWLTTTSEAALVFDVPDAQKWGAALETLGVDPMVLSGDAGHA